MQRTVGFFDIRLTANLPRNLPQKKKFLNRLRIDKNMVMSMWSRFWPTQYVRVVLTGSRPDVITATKPGFRIAYCASAYPVDGTAGIMFSGCPSV